MDANAPELVEVFLDQAMLTLTLADFNGDPFMFNNDCLLGFTHRLSNNGHRRRIGFRRANW